MLTFVVPEQTVRLMKAWSSWELKISTMSIGQDAWLRNSSQVVIGV
jgi:hypothetical protein